MPDRVAQSVAAAAARISSTLGPQTMRAVAQFNKYATNPLQRLWASRLRHMAVVEHRGRNSGTRYQTPVMVFVENGHLAVALNYGRASDWVRNVESAGTAVAVHKIQRYNLTNPRILPADSPDLPAGVRVNNGANRDVLQARLTPA